MRQTSTSLQGYKIAALTSHAIHLPEYQRSSCSPAVRSVKPVSSFLRPQKGEKKTAAIELQYSSQILKHLSDFPFPNVDLGLQSFQCSKIRSAQHWGRRGAHLSEDKGVKSECKKFGENSRQMAPVSTICDEHCRVALPSLDATDRKETTCCLRGYFRTSLTEQDEKGILFLVKNKVKKIHSTSISA